MFSGASSDAGMRCYVQPLSGGLRRPVTPEGVTHFKLSVDGSRFLARLSDSRGDSTVMYDASGKSTPVPHLTRFGAVWYWESKSNIALVTRRSEGHTYNDFPLSIEEMDIGTGHRKPFCVVDRPERLGLQYVALTSVTPDRHAYAYWASWSRSSLYLVEPAK